MTKIHSQSKPVLKRMKDKMPFGKFKGHTIEYILSKSPSYIVWLVDEEIADVSDEIYQEAQMLDWEEDDDYCHDIGNMSLWGIDLND